MRFLLLTIPLFLAVVLATHHEGRRYKQRYTIYHQWDGVPLDRETNLAYVELSTHGDDGELRVDVAAPFWNSPARNVDQWNVFQNGGECPAGPYRGDELCRDNEVVEVVLGNAQGHLLQIAVSPYGNYVVNLKERSKVTEENKGIILRRLLLGERGVQVDNQCVDHGDVTEDCDRVWTATYVVPREYLPSGDLRFNAHYVHGRTQGQAEPAESDFVFESVFASLEDRDYEDGNAHRVAVGALRPVDVHELGVRINQRPSELWQNALNEQGNGYFQRVYEVAYTSDCHSIIANERYRAEVTLRRNNDDQSVNVNIRVEDDRVRYRIPEVLQQAGINLELDTDSESVWLSFSNNQERSVRIGINPYGAYLVQLRDDNLVDEVVQEDLELRDVQVSVDVGDEGDWEADFNVPWGYLPSFVSNFQAIHFHRPLDTAIPISNANQDVPPQKRSHHQEFVRQFVGAVCPGFDEDNVDWVGCVVDGRTLIDPRENRDVSTEWKEAIPMMTDDEE